MGVHKGLVGPRSGGEMGGRDSRSRCNTVDFTDCQYGGEHRGLRLSISTRVVPQCAAGVNSPVKRIAPPRFNCSSSTATVLHAAPLRMSRTQLIMMQFSVWRARHHHYPERSLPRRQPSKSEPEIFETCNRCDAFVFHRGYYMSRASSC